MDEHGKVILIISYNLLVILIISYNLQVILIISYNLQILSLWLAVDSEKDWWDWMEYTS